MAERDLISGEPTRCEVGRDMGRQCALPREALLCWYLMLPEDAIKPNRLGEPEAGRVQRVADSRIVLKTQGR